MSDPNHYIPPLASPDQLGAGRLPVSELFESIQGEGRFAGVPALFIRLNYCNLGCIWCDTRYTWDTHKLEPGEVMSIEALVASASGLVPEQTRRACTHVVITGGEPMLHQGSILPLVTGLQQAGFAVFEIETNGVVMPAPETLAAIDWWNCSPKLSNSQLPEAVRIAPEVLRALASCGRADFKFVVRELADIIEIERDFLTLIPRDRVMLMPEGNTRERQLTLMPWVMAQCRERGFRFSPRLHILAWGNERGK